MSTPLADWRDGPDHLDRTAGASSIYDLRLSARQHHRRRRLRLGTTPAPPIATPSCAAPSLTAAPAKPWVFRYKGHSELVEQSALPDVARRHRSHHAHRLGAALQADLVHRARLPRRRQGCQPAQRLYRSKKLRIEPALLFGRDARRLHATPLPAGRSHRVRPRPPRLHRRRQSAVGALPRQPR
jgi:hypothetical protein